MRKVVVIFLLPVILIGCSVIRKTGKNLNTDNTTTLNDNIWESTKYQNITNNGFFIQKAEIELLSQNGKEKYLASIKFSKPDIYLISLKSRTGIEGARIFISGDSVLVNDRINRRMYAGNGVYLRKKFGLTPGLLPLIFGDAILDKNCSKSNEKCIGDKILTECHVKGVILNYEIECEKRKVVTVSQLDSFNKRIFKLTFNNFFRVGSNLVPRTIEFEDSQFNTVVKIKVLKLELPWNGSIKFIPGSGFEIIELV